jgi:hypothetical protein
MEKSLITIEYEVPGFSDCFYRYSSDQSLLDADVIIFEPEKFDSDSGKASYDESYSDQLKRDTEHWRKELATALEYGKTVFLIFRKYQLATVYTGRKELKGTRTINYVEDYSNYEFLPIALPAIVSKSGTEIVFTGNPAFSEFWKEFKKYLRYESYLNDNITTPIFVTKTGERPIGGVFKLGKGNLVLIPPPVYDQEKFITKNKKKEDIWTKPALEFGRSLVKALFDIDKILKAGLQRTPPPSWVDSPIYSSTEEEDANSAVKKASQDIEKLLKEKEELIKNLANTRQPKDLLFETGKSLENAVTEALNFLGYSAENYNDGNLELDQVIVSPEKKRFIGECEGKDTSAVSIDKFRQLEENIQSDLQRDDVTEPAIGILFGNGFRLTKPEDRQEQFTTKCLTSAKRGTILVRTADLYPIVRYLRENKDDIFAKACRDAIAASKGTVVKFPPTPSNK